MQRSHFVKLKAYFRKIITTRYFVSKSRPEVCISFTKCIIFISALKCKHFKNSFFFNIGTVHPRLIWFYSNYATRHFVLIKIRRMYFVLFCELYE